MAMKLFDLSPIGKVFQRFKSKDQLNQEEQVEKNSEGTSQEQLDSLTYKGNFASAGVSFTSVDFDQLFKDKKDRIVKYREMAQSSEVSESIENICDEAVTEDDEGRIINLNIDDEVPKNVQKKQQVIWEYITQDLFKLPEKGWELFEKWLIEGELYIELIINKDRDNIIGYKVLPAWTMYPVYDGTRIVGFKQTVKRVNANGIEEKTEKNFNTNQIVYIKYNRYGKNNLDTRGYLDKAIKPFNQLRALEDSLIVYRIVRAPERKVWNIDVGRMPKGKAEEYIKNLIHKYKKNTLYDPNTGKVDITANIQSLQEDYWFARTSDGEGTSVETIGGGMQLGELTDVEYFREKLYAALRLPRTRWDKDLQSTYSAGRIGEVSREEVKFARFVYRLQNMFKYIVIQPFLTMLKMRDIDEKWINPKFYSAEMNRSNLVAEYKRIEVLEAKFGVLSTASSYIIGPENMNQPEALFAKEFVLRKYFNMSDEDYEENKNMIEEMKKEIEKSQEQEPPPEGDGGETGEFEAPPTQGEDDPTNKSPLSVAKNVGQEESEEKPKILGFKEFVKAYK